MFLVSYFNFLFIPCGRLSWLPVSILLHVKYTLSYRSDSAVENHQFGFKAGLSTSLCTNVLKQTVDYYTNRGSYVFACFIDFQKAFDKVNYWKLFLKLLDDGVNNQIVQNSGTANRYAM